MHNHTLRTHASSSSSLSLFLLPSPRVVFFPATLLLHLLLTLRRYKRRGLLPYALCRFLFFLPPSFPQMLFGPAFTRECCCRCSCQEDVIHDQFDTGMSPLWIGRRQHTVPTYLY